MNQTEVKSNLIGKDWEFNFIHVSFMPFIRHACVFRGEIGIGDINFQDLSA
jgi:hypothetical protein